MDKNAAHIDALGTFGFGHIEAGTVTPLPQPGNPKPRLFRLVPAQGLINRMGFNNDGVERFVANVRAQRRFRAAGGVLGLNIGKNASTPIERAVDDLRRRAARGVPRRGLRCGEHLLAEHQGSSRTAGRT